MKTPGVGRLGNVFAEGARYLDSLVALGSIENAREATESLDHSRNMRSVLESLNQPAARPSPVARDVFGRRV